LGVARPPPSRRCKIDINPLQSAILVPFWRRGCHAVGAPETCDGFHIIPKRHERFLGAAIGAGAGAYSGKLSDIGINDEFMNDLGQAIAPGAWALFVLVRKATPDKLLKEPKRFQGGILKKSQQPTRRRGCGKSSSKLESFKGAAAWHRFDGNQAHQVQTGAHRYRVFRFVTASLWERGGLLRHFSKRSGSGGPLPRKPLCQRKSCRLFSARRRNARPQRKEKTAPTIVVSKNLKGG